MKNGAPQLNGGTVLPNDAYAQMLDVAIVGAGAAGVGCGVLLRQLGVKQFALLERHEVGASFARWLKEMCFITPSFTSNGFNLLDLNAIALLVRQGSYAIICSCCLPGAAPL